MRCVCFKQQVRYLSFAPRDGDAVIAHGGTLGTGRSTLGGAQFWFEFPRVETSERPAASTDSVMRS